MPTITVKLDDGETGGTGTKRLTFRPRQPFIDGDTIVTPDRFSKVVTRNTATTVTLRSGPWQVSGINNQNPIPFDVGSSDANLKDLISLSISGVVPSTVSLTEIVNAWLAEHGSGGGSTSNATVAGYVTSAGDTRTAVDGRVTTVGDARYAKSSGAFWWTPGILATGDWDSGVGAALPTVTTDSGHQAQPVKSYLPAVVNTGTINGKSAFWGTPGANAGAGPGTAAYLVTPDLGEKVFHAKMRFMVAAGGNNTGGTACLAIIGQALNFQDGSVSTMNMPCHVRVMRQSWAVDIWVAGTGLVNLDSGGLAQPWITDASTEYAIEVWISGNTLTFVTPDGVTRKVTDPRIGSFVGTRAFAESYVPSATDDIVAVTHFSCETVSAAKATSPGDSDNSIAGSVLARAKQQADGVGIVRSVVSVTSAVTLGAEARTDYAAFVGASGAPTLPTAVGNTNRYTFKNIDSTAKTITTTSSQTIDGAATLTLQPSAAVDLISDGSNWRII